MLVLKLVLKLAIDTEVQYQPQVLSGSTNARESRDALAMTAFICHGMDSLRVSKYAEVVRTERPTDAPSFRDERTHLKMFINGD